MPEASSVWEIPKGSSSGADPVRLRNILMATDFSECSERALHYAIGIAARYTATLHLFHWIDCTPYNLGAPDALQTAGETAWRDLQKLASELRGSSQAKNVEVKFRVEAVGELQTVLPEIVRDHAIDLIVVGTHGRTGFKKLVLGSVAETVVDYGPCPVLVVGPYADRNRLEQLGPESILFASDSSSRSRLAEAYAFSLARKYKSRLTIADILEDHSGRVLAEVSQLQWLDSELKHPLGTVPAKIPPLPDDIGTRADMILDVANDAKADLIVLSVPTAHRFANRIVITNSYRVVCGAHCPVLTVRTGVD